MLMEWKSESLLPEWDIIGTHLGHYLSITKTQLFMEPSMAFILVIPYYAKARVI